MPSPRSAPVTSRRRSLAASRKYRSAGSSPRSTTRRYSPFKTGHHNKMKHDSAKIDRAMKRMSRMRSRV